MSRALQNYYREDECGEARVAGRAAFRRGEARNTNPHDDHFGSAHEMRAWYRGWDYAKEDAEKERAA